jgi:hypothetical protein
VRYLGQDKRGESLQLHLIYPFRIFLQTSTTAAFGLHSAGNCIKLGGPSTDSGKEKKSTTILEWLSSIDMQPKQQDILSRRHGNTGEWILKNESFNDWMHNDSVNFLWCPGGREFYFNILTSQIDRS